MSLIALLVAALGAPAPAACPDAALATVELGRSAAPVRLHAFFDPAASGANGIYAELRGMVAERSDELAVSLWIVRPVASFDPRLDRVRRFVSAAARLDRLGDALTLVARVGPDHVAASLLDEARTRAFAPSLRVDAARLLAALATGCDEARVDAATSRVLALGRNATLGLVRLPAFAIGTYVFDDTPGLERVRPELGREPVRRALRWRSAGAPTVSASVALRSERRRIPAAGGLVLGGIGLPHRLAVIAQSESDPNLFLSLPRALRFRSEHPGRLAIHIQARGSGFGANVLRARLCAAARLGRELDYARLLSAPPDLRRDPAPSDSDLLGMLDREAEAHCEDEPVGAVDSLPEGTWLDGVARSPTELDELPNLLRQATAAHRALDVFIVPVETEPRS